MITKRTVLSSIAVVLSLWLPLEAATTFKNLYPATGSTLTITLASLASTFQVSSAALDNTTNLDLDLCFQAKVKTGTISGTAYVNVYVYGTADGTTYDDNITPSATASATILSSPPNVAQVAVINTPASTTTYVSKTFCIAQAFGGVLPLKVGLIFENKTGGALDATAGNFAVLYTRVQAQGI